MEVSHSAEDSNADWPLQSGSLPSDESFRGDHRHWSCRLDSEILEYVSQQNQEGEQIDGAFQHGAQMISSTVLSLITLTLLLKTTEDSQIRIEEYSTSTLLFSLNLPQTNYSFHHDR